MEPGKKKLRFEEGANLAARYNKLVIVFKLFSISLTLIIVALITYLVRTELSEQSIHNHNNNPSLQNQISTSQSEVIIFKLSLQRAAQELENATASLHPTTEANFTRCREWLQTGSARLREAIRADPFPQTPSNKQRAEMSKRVLAAESYIEWCLDDLASVAAAGEVRERVFAAAAFLREKGDFLEKPRRFRQTIWDVIVENVIVVCLFGFQMLVIFFMFWTIIKSH